MEFHFYTVTSIKQSKTARRPVIVLRGYWLAEAGFDIGKLVMAKFTMGEIVFNPCGLDTEGIEDLICQPDKSKGMLLRVRLDRSKPRLDLSGIWLLDFGFSIGTRMVAVAGTGVIKVKILDADMFTL